MSRDGGTPSCIALRSFEIDLDPPSHVFTHEEHVGEKCVVKHTVGLSNVAPYPNIAVYENVDDSYQEERLVINTSAYYEGTQWPARRELNPPQQRERTRY